MIVFDLRCVKDHRFEGWFASHEEFGRQLAAGQVSCPYCDDTRIEKALSPVAIKKSPSSLSSRAAGLQAWAQLCRYVQDKFEDVGHNFAKEALARIMHEPPAATADLAVLPGVLGSRILRRTDKYASDPVPPYRGMVARWHSHLHDLATASRA